MKALLTGLVLVVCFTMCIACIFVCDSYNMKVAEIQYVENIVFSSLAKELFNGYIAPEEFANEAQARTVAAFGDGCSVELVIQAADADKKLVAYQLKVTYPQAGVKDRTIESQKVYILEQSSDLETSDYRFIRAMGKEFCLYDEEGGGPKSDSVWRTPEYATLLQSVLN